jgi:hypothetical protein
MTPWFVAGMGVLITATIVLESPADAVLSYGPPAGSPCGAPGCVRTAPRHAHGSLASGPGIQLEPRVRTTDRARRAPVSPAPHHAVPPKTVTASPAAVTVSFRVVSRDHRGFIAMITMYSQGGLGDWKLGFAIPGTIIRGVGGARWQSSGGDSGVAQAQQSPWLRSQSGTRQARFMVFGTGVPGQPTNCSFDGRNCAFG